MPRDHVTKLYKFEELPNDKAKERAREWYREFVFSDSNDWEFVFEDAVTIAALFGLEIATKRIKGHVVASKDRPAREFTREETQIFFSGFWSQGDGACFEGRYEYKAGGLAAVKEHAPQDSTLHDIVGELEGTQEDLQKADGYTLIADTKHSGHYYHSGCMDVSFDATDFPDGADDTKEKRDRYVESEKAIIKALRRFADWIYRQLEAEHRYQSSNEAIDESLIANEYEFTADGKRCTC